MPTPGNLTIEDVQRHLAQQVMELHLDKRLASSKDLLNKHLATGQKKVSTAFNNLWANIEVMRKAQHRRHKELQAANLAAAAPAHKKTLSMAPWFTCAPDLYAYAGGWRLDFVMGVMGIKEMQGLGPHSVIDEQRKRGCGIGQCSCVAGHGVDVTG
ncbi:MAG: Avl9 [Lasallia pustulata]|uniref:Avl9 n=1 Tax=Lasallia pustulata TaxID=136370 RepID=A0A5M8PLS1_9LECA|nr:MAG: Avl9 [Lasallia pustulata]